MDDLVISEKRIGPTQPCFVIGEAGVNHNGSLDLAKKLIDVACEAAADAVKFQSFKAEEVASVTAPKAEYQIEATGLQESQLDMLRRLELSSDDHLALKKYCDERQIEFMSTPFDSMSIDLLVTSVGVRRLKIPSGEITNARLLLKAALTGLPVILSSGMSTLNDIEQALGVLAFGYQRIEERPCRAAFSRAFALELGRGCLKDKVTLLHCTTEYPAPFEDVNLKAMETMEKAFGLAVGYSDHTRGIAVPIAAVARGATMIEKHFTLDKTMEGPDHKASLEPCELVSMVKGIREVERALANGLKVPSPSEAKNIPVARRSLVAACEIRSGEVFTEHNLTVKRPGNGVSALEYYDWLGQVAQRNYYQDELISGYGS